MERRKESLNDIKLCRFCLTKDSSLTSLYDRSRDPTLVTLPLKIMACVSIEVFPSDKMPSYICERCRTYMDICYDFKQICRRADESCLQFVQNGIPITAIPWPLQLTKIFNLAKRARLINTVIEGGASLQVTSQDASENDEDEETYNIKIDTSGAGSTQVSPSGHSAAAPKKAGFQNVAKLSRHVRSHAGERAYPCKYCNKSFIKSHHYTRHLRVKHEAETRAARGSDEFRCEQCEESFATQDDLYYHSAIHATENLICPLCQEKFENVDAVTTHIRTHVNGIEFMCEYCELVFTSKEKLDTHMNAAHDDEITPREEMGMDDSSAEADTADADADVEDDDEDNGLNVKEEEDHMVVEIKKADGYMLRKDIEVGQITNTNSEDSEMEATYAELSTVDTLELALAEPSAPTRSEATSSRAPRAGIAKNREGVGILRKAEAIKRRAAEKDVPVVPQKKDRMVNVDSTTNIAGSSDKSLRILEKELQELKRTNTRGDGKVAKAGEAKSKRQPVHTSTPKLRSAEEKNKPQAKPAVEKKAPEQRPAAKDNKEPKEKEARNAVSSSKEDKNVSSTKDDKPCPSDKNSNKKDMNDTETTSTKDDENAPEKQAKKAAPEASSPVVKEEKTSAKEPKAKGDNAEEQPSSSKCEVATTSSKPSAEQDEKSQGKDKQETVKNGDTSSSEENIIRRSTRPSKIKNYASMIRDRTRIIRDEDDDQQNSDDDEDAVELKEADSRTPPPRRSQPRRQKPPTPLIAGNVALAHIARRRGRPRKETTPKDKEEEPQAEGDSSLEKSIVKDETKDKPEELEVTNSEPATASQSNALASTSPTSTEPQPSVANTTLVSPTGQTLKKVSAQALPPGIKPLPLPLNARPGDLCSMQIGKKMVKVQKIIMTKAEVEAMAKKGLLELKDGTMVLKQGIKLPAGDAAALRSGLGGLVSQGAIRKMSSTPTRCNIDGEDP